ncbi:MAG: substrate-binding domain-containing protein [Actinomycetota bacterium]|nr:substrate-binding domain-containing protein [Actinomycetota bacterium]
MAPATSYGATSPGRTESPKTTRRVFTVAFVAGIIPESYFNSMLDGLEFEAKKLGDIHLIAPAVPTYSPETQVPILDTLLAKKPAALILAPTDVHALDPTVVKYNHAGVPVFLTDAPTSNLGVVKSLVESNNYLGGEMAAAFIGKRLHGKGTVGVINFVPGSGSGMPRQEGFYAEMKKRFPGIHVLPVQYDGDHVSKGAEEASSELLSHPALKAFFGVNDNAAEGIAAGVAEQHAQGKVIVVGYDADPAEVAYLQEGKLTALVAQHPYEEGVIALGYVHDWLTGSRSKVVHFQQLGLSVVTRGTLGLARKDHILYQGKIDPCSCVVSGV